MNEWTDSELAVLREHYPKGGSPAVQAILPRRTKEAITKRADRIGVRFNRPPRSVDESWPGRLPINDQLDVVAREWRAANAGTFLPCMGVRCEVA